RKFAATMVRMAKVITDAEISDAAGYFASLKPRLWIRVVEADAVPKSYIGPGNKRLLHPDGGTEPLGNRIIEVPEDEEVVVYRDPMSGFVAYVPKGSIAKGKELASTGNGKTVPCSICHGRTLQGLGDVPAIAGRHPNYIVRQLWNMQNGERVGTSAALMQQVVEKLNNDDMLAIAAYVASLAPSPRRPALAATGGPLCRPASARGSRNHTETIAALTGGQGAGALPQHQFGLRAKGAHRAQGEGPGGHG